MTKEEKRLYDKEYYIKNKEKRSKQHSIYHKKNKTILAKLSKEYRENNKESIKLQRKQYRIKNKTIIREKAKIRENNLLKTNPLFKLKHTIKTAIRNSFRYKTFKKKNKTFDILCCDFITLKLYIESKFEPWMNWNNHGKYNGQPNYGWDIDHIIPLSSAKTEKELIKLNHYANLQPLCSYKNRDIKKDLI